MAGLPKGVFNVLTTNRSRLVGAELLTHPLIRKIGFTGSTDVGKGIMETAAKQVTRLSFELGGNAPFIVFDDAEFEAALEGAVAMKFLRVGGQSCICANRIYVQRGIAERFIPAFVDAVEKLKVAPGFEPGDFDLQVRGDQLVMKAEHKAEKEEQGMRSWQRQEFYRVVPLPAATNPDKVDARYKNGVLTITLPKTEKAVGKKIAIKE